MRQLAIYMNDDRAGILTEENPGRGYTFCYDDKYLASGLPSISVTLPKRKQKYESDILFPFFANMVVEGGNRRVICRLSKIDERDFFGLLQVMADQDCIGAVNLRTINDEND